MAASDVGTPEHLLAQALVAARDEVTQEIGAPVSLRQQVWLAILEVSKMLDLLPADPSGYRCLAVHAGVQCNMPRGHDGRHQVTVYWQRP